MVKVTPSEIKLGSIQFGSPKVMTFKIKNDYHDGSSIIIDRMLAGCSSCTTVTYDLSELSPGQEATATVIFTPGSTGHQVKRVFINASRRHPGNGSNIAPFIQPMDQLMFKFEADVHG